MTKQDLIQQRDAFLSSLHSEDSDDQLSAQLNQDRDDVVLHTAHGKEPDDRFIASPGQIRQTELRSRKESLKSLNNYPARVRGLVVSNINVRESAKGTTDLEDMRVLSTRGNNPIVEADTEIFCGSIASNSHETTVVGSPATGARVKE